MYHGGASLVLLSFILWVAAGVSDWWITEPPLRHGLIVPLSGFSIGGIVAGVLSWLGGMWMILASRDIRTVDVWLRPGLVMLGLAMILMLVSIISGWETIDWGIGSVLFISGKTLPMATLILGFLAGALGSLLVTASYGTPDETEEKQPSRETQIARQYGIAATRQQGIREIARMQGATKRQDHESRIEVLEREIERLRGGNADEEDGFSTGASPDTDDNVARARSQEIAELLRQSQDHQDS